MFQLENASPYALGLPFVYNSTVLFLLGQPNALYIYQFLFSNNIAPLKYSIHGLTSLQILKEVHFIH